VHPTYRYLERAPRIAGLTWRQWLLALGGMLAAYLLARVLPLPSPYHLTVATTLAGTPVVAALALDAAEHDLALSPAALVRWRRAHALHLPAAERESSC
jgi:hypothetical protein